MPYPGRIQGKGVSPIGYLFLWEGVWEPWERLFGEVVAYGVARGSSIVGRFFVTVFSGPATNPTQEG